MSTGTAEVPQGAEALPAKGEVDMQPISSSAPPSQACFRDRCMVI